MAVPVNLGQYNGGYGRLSTIIESAEATGDYTVELRLTQPYYNTLRELCLANPFGIVSSEQLNDDLTAKDTFGQPPMEPAHICTKGTMMARHGILYAIPTIGVKHRK